MNYLMEVRDHIADIRQICLRKVGDQPVGFFIIDVFNFLQV